MAKIKVFHMFQASHQLPDTPTLLTKGCARLHGHSYAVKVEAESNTLVNGMVVDFKVIKEVIDTLDHRHLNDIIQVPTAENIAQSLKNLIQLEIQKYNPEANVTKVELAEGYKGEFSSWVEV